MILKRNYIFQFLSQRLKYSLLGIIFIFSWIDAIAQTTVVKGRVTDANTGEPIPFVNVFFPKTKVGTVTDFDGNYLITTDRADDSICARYLGYKMRTKFVYKGKSQELNIQLEASGYELKEVVVRPGENPAFRILRKIWENRDKNDKRSLDAYSYETYSKIEADANNIESFKKVKLMAPFRKILDSLKLIAGEDGKPVLPFFMSETISDYFYAKGPERKKEIIKANKTKGVGVNDVQFMQQVMGASFQDYNFYQNYINILEKNVISPLASAGITFYHYYLVDSLVIDQKYCYKIEFKPRNSSDLAFNGTMWITDTTFALKRLTVELGGKSNLNYIDRLKIQQDLIQTAAGPWLPAKVRILVDIAELTKKSAGVLLKLYVSNDSFIVNKEKPYGFFKDRIEVAEDAQDHSDAYWDANRHDALTKEDKQIYSLIDSVKNIPKIKTYIDVIDVVVNGYYRAGKYFEIGPYIFLYGFNQVEGSRLRLGFRSNSNFSKKWILKGYGAYGIRDNKFKYNAQVEYFLNRKNWTKIGIQRKEDIEELGVQDEFFGNNSNLLAASTQLGLLTRLNKVEMTRVWLESDLFKGFNERLFFLNKNFVPVGRNYHFGYYPNQNDHSRIDPFYTVSEISSESRYAFKDAFLVKDNRRVRVAIERSPIFIFKYTLGLKGVLGSDFYYHKLNLNINQKVKMGALGIGQYSITGTKVFNPLPYPLLDIQLGNETFVRSDEAFNLMRFFEFAGDQSITAFYTHHFDGLIFNRIPLLKELKWREVGGIKAAMVYLSNENRNLLPEKDPNGNIVDKVRIMRNDVPYVEAFYGIENIFKILRIDAIHRITYLNSIDSRRVPRFYIKGSLYLSF